MHKLEDPWHEGKHVRPFHEAAAVCQTRCNRLSKSNAGEDSRAASGRRRGRGRQRQARGGERGGLAGSPPSCTHGGVLEGRAAVLVGQQGLGRPLAGMRGRSLGEDTSPELGPWPGPDLAPWEQPGGKEVWTTRRLRSKACYSEGLSEVARLSEPGSLVHALRGDRL